MTSFRRYIVTNISNGLQISTRKHPLDAEGTPEWLIELVRETYNVHRRPVILIRQPFLFRFTTETLGVNEFNLVEYYKLIRQIAVQLMRDWTPPEIDDEYVDRGPPEERRRWSGLREWALSRTASSINKMIYEKWKLLREGADPVALAVQKKVFSAAFGIGTADLVMTPEFYLQKYFVKDVLDFRAAAAAAGLASRISSGDIEKAMTLMANWRGMFSPSNSPYTSLNKTLTSLPPGIPAGLLYNLSQFILPKPITSRLELLTTLIAHHSQQQNVRVFDFAAEEQIAEAFCRVNEYLHANLSLRRWRDVGTAIQFMCDYPERHKGNIVGLAEKSIRWHRHGQDQEIEKTLKSLGESRAVELPPIPLPVEAGVRLLSTVGEIVQEGREMQHCIAAYAMKAVEGNCYLFSVEHEGQRASVEVSYYGEVTQAFGPKNQTNRTSEWGRSVLRRWGHRVRKAFEARMNSLRYELL